MMKQCYWQQLSWFMLVVLGLGGCGAGGSSPSVASAPPIIDEPPAVDEPPQYESLPIIKPKQLCIYYGQPDLVNGTHPVYSQDETGVVYDVNIENSATEFNRCGLVVLGDGLAVPTDPAYYTTQLIIYSLASKGIPIFGYVDAGVSTQNLAVSAFQNSANLWKAMGVNGIFLDDFGFDYGTTRVRQNALLDVVHGLGLQAFVNAFNPDDVFGANSETGAKLPPKIQTEDYYLAENWLYAEGRLTSMSTWMEKSLKLETYLQTYAVHLAATSTTATAQATIYDGATAAFQYAYWGSVLQRAEFYQWTDNDFSSSDNRLPTYNDPAYFPLGASFDRAITQSSDAAGLTYYTRSYNTTGSIGIYGDGSTRAGVKLQ